MRDSTGDSEVILHDAGASLRTQRAGGFHRRKGTQSVGRRSIGRGSAEVRRSNLMTRIKLIAAALFAIVIAASFAGIAIGGIGFTGIMVTFLAIVAAVMIFGNYPKVRVPRRADLNRGDVKSLVSRTELWLEHQRPALPAPAVTLVDQIGIQLDALGLQLEHVDQAHPASAETRKLVGEYLPEMIDSYRRIPEQLRHEERAGATPDQQLVDSLSRISGEIDHVTRQLADGALDDLAIRSRYLDYKFGGELEGPDSPVALPARAATAPTATTEPR